MLLSHGLGREPLWLDEAYTYAMVQHAPGDIVALTAEDVHPPLYYFIARLSQLLLADTDAALRAPSLLLARAQSGDDQPGSSLAVWIVDAEKAPFHLSDHQLAREPGWQRTWGPEQVALPMSWVRLQLSRWSFVGPKSQL